VRHRIDQKNALDWPITCGTSGSLLTWHVFR
jgi:hypothetical protein